MAGKVLVVVDMQKDFVDGALGTPEAQAIVPAVVAKVRGWQGRVLFTQDTHYANYLDTQEGKHLPVPHCVEGTPGWKLVPELAEYVREHDCLVLRKTVSDLWRLPWTCSSGMSRIPSGKSKSSACAQIFALYPMPC